MKVPSAFSIGRATSTNEQKRNMNPGPGTHTLSTTNKATPSWGFGRQKKMTTRDKETPGPGAYDICHKEKGNKFSMRKKDKTLGYNVYENPGPEKYNQKDVFKFKSNPRPHI